MWLPALFLRALCMALLSHAGAHAQTAPAPLTRAIDIRTLSYERALEKLPVDLTATVGFVESSGTAFVQDATAGTHLHFKPARAGLRVGDRVLVRGTTTAGLYLPGVDVATLTVLGHEAAPAAQSATYDDLATGRYHYQRVRVAGLGRTLTPLDENRSLLRLAMGSRVIEVRVDSPPESAPAVVDARLHLTALAAGGINDRRQLVFPYLRVTDWSDVSVAEAAAAPEAQPITSAATLLQFGTADEPHNRVRIRGTVLAALADGRVFLRDSTPPPPPRENTRPDVPEPPQSPSIAIRLTTPTTLLPGDVAEITGFPIMAGFSASLADAMVLSATPGEEPGADAVPLREFQDGSHDADLVRLTTPAVLNDFFRTNDGFELRLTSAGLSIRAFLLQAEVPALQIGAVYQITGICLIESSTDKGFRSQPERASLLLRGGADLVLVSSPPFWNAGRLGRAVALLLSMVLFTIILLTMQRRQITRLQGKIVHQATLDERQRIAREFHDTLEQELAGLSLRLDAATTRPLEDKARTLLETSRNLVSRIQSEARNLVSDLRETEHPPSLPAALQALAERTRDHLPVVLDLQPIPPISGPVSHHLRMIAQETITNAIKHAQATEITLHLSATATQLLLSIRDNGRGFAADPEAETHGKPGHFGCIGIRERCRKIGAEAEWVSEAGKGTLVRVRMNL